MFTRDIRSSHDIVDLYVNGYGDKRQMSGQKVNASVNRLLLNKFNVDLAGKSVLDVGAGYGFFLAMARRAGARRVVGVELSEAARGYAIKELNLDMCRDFESVNMADKFDVITLFEVIEHVPEPYELLLEITKYLNNGGSLVIGTDNFDSDVVRTLGANFPKWIPHEHVSLFTAKSLISIVQRITNLRVVGVRSFTPWELLARELTFKLTRGRKGGRDFSVAAENRPNRQYEAFAMRLAVNGLWFNLTNRANLNGEMMYTHAIKNRQ
jgi:2-polyprenyl-3-methyl-5-hydroxy-6-metoxy-1,4-benzoquinol methylase